MTMMLPTTVVLSQSQDPLAYACRWNYTVAIWYANRTWAVLTTDKNSPPKSIAHVDARSLCDSWLLDTLRYMTRIIQFLPVKNCCSPAAILRQFYVHCTKHFNE